MIEDRPLPTPDLTSRPLDWSPTRPAISKVPYLPGLDGMRAIAVVAVMIYHTNNGWLPGGFIGVEVFFVISGYLITLLLIGEHEKTGHIDLKQFWLRRARRLLPALFFLVAALMTYCAIFNRDQLGNIRGDVIAGLGYVSNWYQIWVGQGYTTDLDFVPLRHLWSLAVEEQFYLFWPLVMVGLIRFGRRRLPEVAMWLIGAALVIAVVTGLLFVGGTPGAATNLTWDVGGRAISRNDTLYLSTITRASGLLIGAAFAMLWRPVAVMRGPMRDRGRQLDLLALVGLAGLAGLAWTLHVAYEDGSGDPWLFRGGFVAVAACTVLVMAAVTHRGASAGTLLGNPVLNWIGTRSYGLYLFHWPIYQIIRKQSGKELEVGQFALAMVITAALTEFSFRFIETPVRKQQLGRWWRQISEQSDPRPRQATVIGGALIVALVGFSTVSMATGKIKKNDVAVIVAEGGQHTATPEEVLAGLNGSTAPPTAPVTAAPPVAPDPNVQTGVTVAPTAPPTAAPAAQYGPPVAIGDSVMVGASAELTALGFTVAAAEGRQFSAEVAFAQQIGAAATPPSVVLVHLGHNGNISQSDADAFFGALQRVPLVIVLNIWGPADSWVAPNNTMIAGLPARFPNVRVADWATAAPGCPQWALDKGYQKPCYAVSDGYHLGANGAEYYALKISEWIAQYKAELGIA